MAVVERPRKPGESFFGGTGKGAFSLNSASWLKKPQADASNGSTTASADEREQPFDVGQQVSDMWRAGTLPATARRDPSLHRSSATTSTDDSGK